MSDMMVCASTLLMMPVVMILSRLSGLPMVKTRSPSCTGAWLPPERANTAGVALGSALMLAQSRATSFCGSEAISRAVILCSRSNCTARYCDCATTCWLVRIRPFPSTKKPVPWPDSEITVTTVFFSFLNCSVRSPLDAPEERVVDAASFSSALAFSLVRSIVFSTPVSVTRTDQE